MRVAAFTLVEIMIVAAIIGILATMAIPLYQRATEYSQMQACISNLRQMDGAKDRLAIEQKMAAGDPVIWPDIYPYFIKPTLNECPAGGTYSINPVATDPTCTWGETKGHTI
ncbi:MAG: prepilin-type N-terminal cleavage/methylation domain-containing protein [Kiritimatiellae bacterium]|nr:prepilin-type N-terminal cleavage/methylation domain-containing protein [Kiritimatiellia bacterium]